MNVLYQFSDDRKKLLDPSETEAIDDLVQHVKQLLVSISANLKIISSIQNTYSTIANNTLNQRMKILTSLTVLLAIPNVFYGMYGMNIALPIQDEWWAYPVIVGFTGFLILLVFIIARRLKLF